MNRGMNGGRDYILEQQRLQLCGLHTINNLLQLTSAENGAVTKKELDVIADDLALAEQNLCADQPIAPGEGSLSFMSLLRSKHRTLLFGNYSIEVLDIALQKRGFKTSWIDVDKYFNPEFLEGYHESEIAEWEKESDKILGFIVNVKSRSLWSVLFFSRHWYAIHKRQMPRSEQEGRDRDRNTQEEWLVLDSKSSEALVLHSPLDLCKHLTSQVDASDAQVFLVTRSE